MGKNLYAAFLLLSLASGGENQIFDRLLPFGPRSGDGNMSTLGTGDIYLLTLGFDLTWFANTHPSLKISKHGQASIDPTWTPETADNIDFSDEAANSVIAVLADNFTSFERGEVHFRSSTDVDDVTLVENIIRGASRTLATEEIQNVVIVTWEDTGPCSDVPGNTFQLVLAQDPGETKSYTIFIYWMVDLQEGMKVGLTEATNNLMHEFTSLSGLASDSNIGVAGTYLFFTHSFVILPPVDAEWKPWSLWGMCSASCEGGTQSRNRTCQPPDEPRGGDTECAGSDTETRDCNTHACSDTVTSWGAWLDCSATCGGGVQVRTRSCNGDTCTDDLVDYRPCNQVECPVDGVWASWSSWSSCGATCGTSTQSRFRQCHGQAGGGAACDGSPVESQDCTGPTCPVDGGWTSWSVYDACSVTCGGGTQRRTRTCDNPPPQHSGRLCVGPSEEYSSCNEHPCDESLVVNGQWTPWMVNGSCSVTCGQGSLSLIRFCANPYPAHGGNDCSGDQIDTQSCEEVPCQVDGAWGWWTSWSACTRTCGDGLRLRYRFCDDPLPAYNGAICPTATVHLIEGAANQAGYVGSVQFQQLPCKESDCPEVHGVWGEWRSLAPCSSTCGGGRKQMIRHCNTPRPAEGGRKCPGGEPAGDEDIDIELFSCNNNPCPLHGKWSEWTTWSECSVSCGTGTRLRSRACDNPVAAFGGVECEGEKVEEEDCDLETCHINGTWGQWQSWTQCTVSCGGGTHERKRDCDNPPPSGNGTDCEGPEQQSSGCNGHVCPPIDGGWSAWSEWTPCSATCGEYGVRTRMRQCTNPWPERGGKTCPGSDYVRARACNRYPCTDINISRDGKWGLWTAWTICPVTCGGAKVRRKRVCDSPRPLGNGSACGLNFPLAAKYPIEESEGRLCGTAQCPVDGDWSSWTSWGTCSKACGGGKRTRSRSCDQPPAAYGGTPCLGGTPYSTVVLQKRVCNTVKCPDSGLIDPMDYADNFNFSAPFCNLEDAHDGHIWPNTNVGRTVIRPCPLPTIGNVSRRCNGKDLWGREDASLCTSAGFESLEVLVSDVPLLARNDELLSKAISVFTNRCLAEDFEVISDLLTCYKVFRGLVDVNVMGDDQAADLEKKERFRGVFFGGNQLLSPLTKLFWYNASKDERHSEISTVIDMSRQFERLAQQMADYVEKFHQSGYSIQLEYVGIHVESVACHTGMYSYPRLSVFTPPTKLMIPEGTFLCDRDRAVLINDQGAEVTGQAAILSSTMMVLEMTTPEAPTTVADPIIGRRRRQAAGLNANSDYYVSTLTYQTLHTLLPSQSRVPYNEPYPYRDPKTGQSEYQDLRVVAASPIFVKVQPSFLGNAEIMITFTHTLEGEDIECAYVLPALEQSLYSSDGCSIITTEKTHTMCECPANQGTYVLIMTPKDHTRYRIPVNPVLIVALIIGTVVHLIILIIYLVLGFFRHDRHFMAVNFIVAFIIAQVVALFSVFAVNDADGCRALAWFLHFLLLAAMFWVLCIAGYSFAEVQSPKPLGWRRRITYILIGWGMPAFVSVITAALYREHIDRTYLCWYHHDQLVFIAYGLPLGITALMTIVILLVAFNRNSPTRSQRDDTLTLEENQFEDEQYYFRRRYLIVMLILLEVIVLNLIMFGIVLPIPFLITNIIQAAFDLFLFLFADEHASDALWRCCYKTSPASGRTTPEYMAPSGVAVVPVSMKVDTEGIPKEEYGESIEDVDTNTLKEDDVQKSPRPVTPMSTAPSISGDVEDTAELVELPDGQPDVDNQEGVQATTGTEGESIKEKPKDEEEEKEKEAPDEKPKSPEEIVQQEMEDMEKQEKEEKEEEQEKETEKETEKAAEKEEGEMGTKSPGREAKEEPAEKNDSKEEANEQKPPTPGEKKAEEEKVKKEKHNPSKAKPAKVTSGAVSNLQAEEEAAGSRPGSGRMIVTPHS